MKVFLSSPLIERTVTVEMTETEARLLKRYLGATSTQDITDIFHTSEADVRENLVADVVTMTDNLFYALHKELVN